MHKNAQLISFFILLSILTTQPGRAERLNDDVPDAPTTPSTIFLPLVGRQTATQNTSGRIVVDHNSIAQFERIPDRYITAARNLRLFFSDRSVGANISEALNCLAQESWVTSIADCRRDYYTSDWDWRTFNSTDLSNGIVPERILFDPNPTKYNRDNWTFLYQQGTWDALTKNFIEELAPPRLSSYDILTYQFSYLNIEDYEHIDDPQTGFFADNPNVSDIYDLEAFIAQHPDKIFFFWTTSLARSIGTVTGLNFNNQMRQYSQEHNKILFDVADIESHTDLGIPCYDNRDGVQYCTQAGTCENYPDDHQDIPAICQDYTTEVNGGHLGSVSAGKVRLAKAFWVLMARIAGWDGQSP